MRWAGDPAGMEAKRDAYRDLVGKPEGKRSLGRPRRRWENVNFLQKNRMEGHGLDSSAP
jgi:hypothetical protein